PLPREMDRGRAEMENRQYERLLQEIAESRRHSDDAIAGLRDELRDEIQASAVETRRHSAVIAESLRSDSRLLAEGILAVDAKVERLNDRLDTEFVETRAMITLSYAE